MTIIRAERPEDHESVRRINELAFGRPAEANLVDLLRGVPNVLSLVALHGDRLAGHIMFSPVTVDGVPDATGYGLGPMAVLPEFQRQGTRSELIRTGLAECRARGIGFVVVL